MKELGGLRKEEMTNFTSYKNYSQRRNSNAMTLWSVLKHILPSKTKQKKKKKENKKMYHIKWVIEKNVIDKIQITF